MNANGDDDRRLAVLLHDARTGELTRSRRGATYTFQYDDAWLLRPDAVPLSRSLPLRHGPFTFDECRPFFAGLLPEGPAREALARALHVSPDNDFLLLERVGGECAGAVSVVPLHAGRARPDDEVRWLSDAELAAHLRELPVRPLLAGGREGLRLSLAGTQQKLPVHYDGEHFGLPTGVPSTHIVKVAIRDFDATVENEAWALKTIAGLGVEAAEAFPARVDDLEFLVVTRYDREPAASAIRRIHQEDACQALGLPPGVKYENEGGPTAGDLFRLVRETSGRAGADLIRLADLVVANYLVGNSDAHGKNFSLLYERSGARLAPAYDVLCTAVYPALDRRMAMRIGREYDPARLRERHWLELADEAGLGGRRFLARARRLAEMAPDAARLATAELEEGGWRTEMLAETRAVVEERSAALLAATRGAGARRATG